MARRKPGCSILAQRRLGSGLIERASENIVRCVTGETYVHVEFVPRIVSHGEVVTGISATRKDGRVRVARILVDDSFDIIRIPVDPIPVWRFMLGEIGNRYDYIGAVLSPFGIVPDMGHGKWFCSNLIGTAFGLDEFLPLTPEGLVRLLIDRYISSEASQDF